MKFYNNNNDNLIPIRSAEGDRCITFFLTPFPTEKKRNFRCMNCGKLLCQYESEIIAGVDGGDKPENKAPIEVFCPRCGATYRLIS